MPSAERLATSDLRSEPLTAAQSRVVAAALDLFAAHGVGGTSLQMIADAIGVTKAAVYHQFNAKEEIVVAAVESELQRLEASMGAAEAAGSGPEALRTLLDQVIDLAVARRRMVSNVQNDPAVVRLLAEHAPFQQFIQRLLDVLLGWGDDSTARVQAAMISSAIGGAVSHPLVVKIGDDELRAELRTQMRRFLDLHD